MAAKNIIKSAQDCISSVTAQTDECLLFLSLGKDSLVTLDLCAPHFRHITCVFMYFVQGLEHIERWVRWALARYPNIEIIQIPHWNLTYALRGGLCCPPDPSVRVMTLRDTIKAMRIRTGLQHTFLGMKMADSMKRRLFIRQYAQNHYCNNGMCYPLAEWTQRDVLAYMRQHRLPEPIRYSRTKPGGGVGLSMDCLTWLRDNCPQDLKKIYEVFPLAERLLWEEEYHRPTIQESGNHPATPALTL